MRYNETLRWWRRAAMGAVVVVLSAVALPLLGQNSGIQYFYDDLGRLIRAVDQNGNVASYSYDAVGNILSISRSTLPPNNGLAVLGFAPLSGSAGQSVTIQGQGFSATAASNTVQFNGVGAAVTGATATSLTVTVPASATTGVVSVTVGGQTANSSTVFTVTNGALQSIVISPGNFSQHAGTQQQFTATGTYANGTQQNLTASVLWGSTNPSAATVSNSTGSQGLVTAGLGGVTTLIATSGAVSGTTTITIVGPTNLSIAPTSASIFARNTQQFSATEVFQDGSSQNVTGNATWSSSNNLVATVSNAPGSVGLVTAVNPGAVTICATYQFETCTNATVVPGVSSVTISPTNVTIPIGLQQFTATGTTGQNITSMVNWSSSNPAVATISNALESQGLATGLSVGTTTITATAGTVSASTTLTITAAVPIVTLSPGRDVIQEGNSFQFKATLVNPDGSKQDITQTATWESSAPGVATVNSQGLVSAVALGSATVTATSGSTTGSASVIVANSSQATVPRYVFTNNFPNNGNVGTVSVYSVNPATGQLRSLGFVLGSGDSQGFALDPASQYLYVANTSSVNAPNTVAAYMIGANGSLTLVPSSPFATGNNPNAVATDPLGRFVYVVSGYDQTVSGFTIGPNGGLTPVSGSPFGVGSGALAVAVDPSGQFVYVMNNGNSTVSAFTIDSNSGSLTPVPGSPFATGTNPAAMAVDPSGRFVLVANQGQNNATSDAAPPKSFPAFSSEGELLLASLETFPLEELGSANATSYLTRGQPYFFDAVELSSSDSVLRLLPGEVGRSGAMHNVPAVSLAQQKSISCGGGSLAAKGGPRPDSSSCASTNPSISVFAVNGSSGVLTPVANSPFAVSGIADSITVDPTDRFVYVTYDSSQIDGFALSASGALSELSDAPYAASENFVSFVAVDPSGQFVYASGGTDALGSNVVIFSLNAGTGSLTPAGNIPGAPGVNHLTISKGSTGVTYTPQFAYVTGGGGTNGANNISGYSINPSSGVLTPLASSPFAEGLSPVATATDPWNPFLYVSNNCSDSGCAAAAGSVSGYTIDPTTGALTTALGSPYTMGSSPSGIAVDPSGSYVYVVDNQDDDLWGSSINLPAGSLSTLPGSPAFASENGSVAVAVDPVGGHTYTLASFGYYVQKCTQNCSNGHLYVYNYPLFGPTTTGQIVPPDNSIIIGPAPSSLALDPAGWFALVTDITTNSVYVISTATQAQVAGSPFATGQSPMSVTLDPLGRFVYVANQGSNNVSAYTIDPNAGILTPVAGSPFAVGNGPVSVSVDFSGSFVYVANHGDNTVSAFSINPASGALTPIAGSPFNTGTAPVSVVTTGTVQ